MINFNELRPFKDYSDLTITVLLGVSSISIVGLADEFARNSYWMYFWYALAISCILLIFVQSVITIKKNKVIKVLLKCACAYFFIYMFFLAIIGLMFVVIGGLQKINAKTRKPDSGESMPEYLSKRNRGNAEAEISSTAGAGVAGGAALISIFLAKYLVQSTSFTPVMLWMKPEVN